MRDYDRYPVFSYPSKSRWKTTKKQYNKKVCGALRQTGGPVQASQPSQDPDRQRWVKGRLTVACITELSVKRYKRKTARIWGHAFFSDSDGVGTAGTVQTARRACFPRLPAFLSLWIRNVLFEEPAMLFTVTPCRCKASSEHGIDWGQIRSSTCRAWTMCCPSKGFVQQPACEACSRKGRTPS